MDAKIQILDSSLERSDAEEKKKKCIKRIGNGLFVFIILYSFGFGIYIAVDNAKSPPQVFGSVTESVIGRYTSDSRVECGLVDLCYWTTLQFNSTVCPEAKDMGSYQTTRDNSFAISSYNHPLGQTIELYIYSDACRMDSAYDTPNHSLNIFFCVVMFVIGCVSSIVMYCHRK